MTSEQDVVTLKGTIPAAPERAYRARLEPGLVKRWPAPGSTHVTCFVGPERSSGPAFDSLLTIPFEEAPGDATELTLVHKRLQALRAAMPDVPDGVEPGWRSVLDQLSEAVQQAGPGESRQPLLGGA